MTATGVASDFELREHAAALLKKEPVFNRLGRRLLADLVTLEGLTIAKDGHTLLEIDFAVLIVLDGTIIVSTDTTRVTPLDSPVTPVLPPAGLCVELRPGLYLRTDPIFDTNHWNPLRIEAPHGQALRFYALTKVRLHSTPAQVLSGLDAHALPPGVGIDVLLFS